MILKKLLAVLFVFLMLFSFSSAESFDESAIVGIWIHGGELPGSFSLVELYQFIDDHSVYYHKALKNLRFESSGSITSEYYTWEIKDDKIVISSDGQFVNDLFYIDDTCLSEFPRGLSGQSYLSFYTKVYKYVPVQ